VDGGGTGSSTYQIYGYVLIHCDYCGALLKEESGVDCMITVELRESSESGKR